MRKPLTAAALVPLVSCVVWGGADIRMARAASSETTLAVLGIEATDGTPDALAGEITDALRQRASATKGLRLIPGRDLMEVKLIFSCPDEAPPCMTQAAKSLGAMKVIFGNVRAAGADSYLVTLKILDANKELVSTWAGEPITKAQSTPGALRGHVQKWFAELLGYNATGTIQVSCNAIGASVSLDGVPSGVIGNQPLILAGVAAGKHDVLVSKLGSAPVSRTVNVVTGRTAEVAVSLERSKAAAPATSPPPAVPMTAQKPPAATAAPAFVQPSPPPEVAVAALDEGSPHPVLRTAAWGTVGATVASFALAIKFGLNVKATNENLDPYRRFKCTTNPKALCDINDQPAKALNPAEQTYVAAEKSQGEKFQGYQYIAYGAGAALAVASGVMLYYGYFAGDGAPAATAFQFHFVPVAFGPTGGGFAAGFRF